MRVRNGLLLNLAVPSPSHTPFLYKKCPASRDSKHEEQCENVFFFSLVKFRIISSFAICLCLHSGYIWGTGTKWKQKQCNHTCTHTHIKINTFHRAQTHIHLLLTELFRFGWSIQRKSRLLWLGCDCEQRNNAHHEAQNVFIDFSNTKQTHSSMFSIFN